MANTTMPNAFPLEESVNLTKTVVTMTGASAELVPADPNRKVIYVSSTTGNADAAIDPTGGTCALDSGIPLASGLTIKISGLAATAAMTQFGTNGQKLTVLAGYF